MRSTYYCRIMSALQEGVGRRVGEQMERVWALAKPLFLRARYMTPAHWWDAINAFFMLLERLQQERMPALLSKKLAEMEGCICEAGVRCWAVKGVGRR